MAMGMQLKRLIRRAIGAGAASYNDYLAQANYHNSLNSGRRTF
jgi:hypothetical protein